MDTMYGLKEIEFLYQLLKEQLIVLYIDANEDKRVSREYLRLRQDSTISDRKADLTITLDEVAEKTRKKDNNKTEIELYMALDKFADFVRNKDITKKITKSNEKDELKIVHLFLLFVYNTK